MALLNQRTPNRFAVDSCLKAFYEYKQYSAEEARDNTSLPLAQYRGSEATSPVSDHIMGHYQPLHQIKSRFIPATAQGFGKKTCNGHIEETFFLLKRVHVSIGLQSSANGIALDTSEYRVNGHSDQWRPTARAPFLTQTRFLSPPCGCRPISQLIPTDRISYSVEEGRYSAHSTPFLTMARAPSHKLTPYCYPAGVHSVSTPYDRPTARIRRRTQRTNSNEANRIDTGSA